MCCPCGHLNSEQDDSRTIGSNYLYSDTDLWFAGPDAAASKLLTGKSPEVLFSIEGVMFEAGARVNAMSPRVLLCIDDRPPVLEIRKTNLEKCGYSVLTANNALTAISILGDTAIAAVLLEYKSEGMDAEAVALNIRRRFPQVPIVLLSAYSELPERILWLVDEYVLKSEPLDGLVQVIERVRGSATIGNGRVAASI